MREVFKLPLLLASTENAGRNKNEISHERKNREKVKRNCNVCPQHFMYKVLR